MSEVNIRPQDFYSDTPPERIMGSECEYMPQFPENKERRGRSFLSDVMNERNLSRYGAVRSIASHSFLGNGGRCYIELGTLLEYCTPETRGPRAAAAADLAGTYFVARLFGDKLLETSDLGNAELYRRAGVAHFGHGNNSTGHHENFMMPRTIALQSQAKQLLALHLATSTWRWGGIVSESGFDLSQKARTIGSGISTTRKHNATNPVDKSLAIINHMGNRDNRILTGPDWARVEVRMSDAPHSPWARFMSFASTSLVLRLAEHADKLPSGAPLVDFTESLPVVLNSTSKDLDMTHTYTEQDSSRQLTALDVQEMLLESIEELSKEVQLPKDEIEALNEWKIVHQQLRKLSDQREGHDFSPLAKKIEWAARHTYLTKKLGHQALSTASPEAIMLDLSWDRVYPVHTGYRYWQKVEEISESPIVDPNTVMYLLDRPPVDTRANARAQALEKWNDISNVRWNAVEFAGDTKISLDDAYNPVLPHRV